VSPRSQFLLCERSIEPRIKRHLSSYNISKVGGSIAPPVVGSDWRLTPARDFATIRNVRSVFALFAYIIALLLPAAAGEKVVMFARLKETTDVALSTGAKWRMDKGDAFPVIAYKESHTVVILQLAGAQFVIPTDKTDIVPDKELPVAIAKYRENVVNYINGFSDRWKRNAQEGKPAQ
jgi:hypothetical protein